MQETDSITVKFNFTSRNEQLSLQVLPTETLQSAIPRMAHLIPPNSRVMFIFEGHNLDQLKTFEELKLQNNNTVQVFISQMQQPAAPANQNVLFRGGFERLLEADVPREDVIRQRLIFLARTGYLQNDQLQILYMNSALLPPPRGYTQPRAASVRQIFINTIKQILNTEFDFITPLKLTPPQITTLYPNQQNPENQQLPSVPLSNISFALMFLEAGVPNHLENEFRLLDFSFISNATPCPTVPLRAMQLEMLWNTNQTNQQNLQQLGQQNDLLGPNEPVVPVNRVMSSFQRLLTMVIGVLLGLVFNILVFPFAFHDSMALELRSGIILGLIGNVFFALFIGIAGIM
ncbi:Ubiquitin_like protein [Hexamita inflata]|uniref:Ubiquitin_like protein n=1 Tax=Hexamita inflata TaxID=28002 RepID=A0ABP1GMD0_9EUKA